MSIQHESWGITHRGTQVDLYTLTHESGMETSIATYGGIITRLIVPDEKTGPTDVVLGYDTLAEYLDDDCYFGCIVGRVANRISRARFTLDGVEYALDRNHGNHQLHGGTAGFNTLVWQAEPLQSADGPQLVLTHVSEDGDQGFPGRLETTVTYTLTKNGLRMEFQAQTDAPTPVSLTNHTYFNLSGHSALDCLDHVLTIPASRYLVTDHEQIPTGEIASVIGTPLDFTTPASIGSRIDTDFAPLIIGQGYDNFFVLDDESSTVRLAATASEPKSGRVLEVFTDQPGVQCYSGNHMPKSLQGKNTTTYGWRHGVCFEPQGYPDAPNRPEFPSVILPTGGIFKQKITYQFSSM